MVVRQGSTSFIGISITFFFKKAVRASTISWLYPLGLYSIANILNVISILSFGPDSWETVVLLHTVRQLSNIVNLQYLFVINILRATVNWLWEGMIWWHINTDRIVYE